MPKYGNITNPAVEISEEIKSVLDHGFDFAEIGIEWPEGSPEKIIKKKKTILDLIGQFDSPPIGHTAWWMDFSSLYEVEWMAWITEAKKCIDVASDLNIKLLNFHSHSIYMKPKYGTYRILALNNFVKSLKEIIKYAEDAGVQVMIENTSGQEEISSLKDYSYVINKLPHAKVHLDVGHAFTQGGMKALGNFIRTFDKRITHSHFSDNHGHFDEHLPVGKGEIDFKSLVGMLKKIKYNRTITFEVFTSRKDAAASMKKIKELW